jgi:hypothetical protein
MQEQFNSPKRVEMVIRLDPIMAHELRKVAASLSMTQISYIRKTLGRGIAFSKRNELPLVETPKIKAALSTEVDLQGVL